MKQNIFIGLILFLLAVAARWYYLPENLFFGAEQGRDALIAESIGKLEDFVLVGPQTDIDGLFHGVWYFYALAIPYFLGQGNPLVASGVLILLSSILPVIMYGLLKDITKSWIWGIVAGLLSVISYEYITYARWLSNVTPAVPLIAFFYWNLWKYRVTKKSIWFVLAVVTSVFAAQFEIILCLLFLFVFAILWSIKWMPLPNFKSWTVSIFITLAIFSPMILFNIRNEFITLKSAMTYLTGSSEKAASHAFDLQKSLSIYASKTNRLVKNTFIPIYDWRVTVLEVTLLAAAVWLVLKRPASRPAVILMVLWSFMTLPVIVFTQSLALTQLYIGAGLGLIGLMVLAMQAAWEYRFGKAVVLLWVGIILSGLPIIESNLRRNSDVLFTTIQDDLNYRDQQALLKYIYTDAQGKPYRFQAFTIPYFREEGWQYLHRYFYPDSTNRDAKLLYTVIEEKVEPYWEKKWIEDVGSTRLIEEQRFGLLRVQKRELL